MENAVKEASKSAKGIQRAYVKNLMSHVRDGKIVEYKTEVRISMPVTRHELCFPLLRRSFNEVNCAFVNGYSIYENIKESTPLSSQRISLPLLNRRFVFKIFGEALSKISIRCLFRLFGTPIL